MVAHARRVFTLFIEYTHRWRKPRKIPEKLQKTPKKLVRRGVFDRVGGYPELPGLNDLGNSTNTEKIFFRFPSLISTRGGLDTGSDSFSPFLSLSLSLFFGPHHQQTRHFSGDKLFSPVAGFFHKHLDPDSCLRANRTPRPQRCAVTGDSCGQAISEHRRCDVPSSRDTAWMPALPRGHTSFSWPKRRPKATKSGPTSGYATSSAERVRVTHSKCNEVKGSEDSKRSIEASSCWEGGGKLIRVPERLVMYRFTTSSLSWKSSRRDLLRARLAAFERRVLANWSQFSIWGAGRDGANFFADLTDANRKKVVCFCDVAAKKLAKGEHITSKGRVPIVHWSKVKHLLCTP